MVGRSTLLYLFWQHKQGSVNVGYEFILLICCVNLLPPRMMESFGDIDVWSERSRHRYGFAVKLPRWRIVQTFCCRCQLVLPYCYCGDIRMSYFAYVSVSAGHCLVGHCKLLNPTQHTDTDVFGIRLSRSLLWWWWWWWWWWI